jgi:tetratricopeptide (TPR) repeat protein
LKREEEAGAYYHQAIKANPLSDSAHDKLGDILNHSEKEDRSMEQYRASADLNPAGLNAHYQLAEHYKSLRDWTSAKREYLTILNVSGGTKSRESEAHKEVAKIYERDEQWGSALYHWREYIKLVPGDQEAKRHLNELRKPTLTKKQAEQIAGQGQGGDESWKGPAQGPSSAPAIQPANPANAMPDLPALPGDAGSSQPLVPVNPPPPTNDLPPLP